MLFKSNSILASIVLATSSFAQTITENTVQISPVDLQIGDLTINSDVYYSIVNNLATVIGGNLDNRGGFYVTSTNGLAAAVALASGTINNSGELAFNALDANVASTYDLASIGAFKNTGDMWFGSAENVASPFTVTSVTDWQNEGLIYFKQAGGVASVVALAQVVGSGGLLSLENNGQICLEGVSYIQTSSIDGSGCINVGAGANAQLLPNVANAAFYIDSDQTVYLSSSSSRLQLLTGGVLANPRIKVAGFGNGNRIVIELTFTRYTYDSDTGILRVTLLGLTNVEFDIGLGYSTDQFSDNAVLGTLGSQIWYENAPPNSAPSDCSCKPFPDPPTSTTTPSSSTNSEPTSAPTGSDTSSGPSAPTGSGTSSGPSAPTGSGTSSGPSAPTGSDISSGPSAPTGSGTSSGPSAPTGSGSDNNGSGSNSSGSGSGDNGFGSNASGSGYGDNGSGSGDNGSGSGDNGSGSGDNGSGSNGSGSGSGDNSGSGSGDNGSGSGDNGSGNGSGSGSDSESNNSNSDSSTDSSTSSVAAISNSVSPSVNVYEGSASSTRQRSIFSVMFTFIVLALT